MTLPSLTNPIEKYIFSREPPFTCYVIPKSIMIDFKISVLKQSFKKFEAVFHSSEGYYTVYTEDK